MYRNIAIAQYRITESQNHHDEQTRALHCAGREGKKSCLDCACSHLSLSTGAIATSIVVVVHKLLSISQNISFLTCTSHYLSPLTLLCCTSSYIPPPHAP